MVVPEFIPATWPAQLLHNQTANILRLHLRNQEDVVVIDVPYHIHGYDDAQEQEEYRISLREPSERN